jgi:hypothetical protein
MAAGFRHSRADRATEIEKGQLKMARKTQSRLELRKQAEAAEGQAQATDGATKKKKREKDPTKKPTRRTKTKVAERKRLMWAVFNGSMKEEGRFAFDQRDAAEERVQQLKLKSPKKIYFIQTIKEAIAATPKTAEEVAAK